MLPTGKCLGPAEKLQKKPGVERAFQILGSNQLTVKEKLTVNAAALPGRIKGCSIRKAENH